MRQSHYGASSWACSPVTFLRWNYAALFMDTGATLNDVREAVTILEDIAGTSRRVIGGAHPLTEGIESHLRKSRAALRARETLSSGSA